MKRDLRSAILCALFLACNYANSTFAQLVVTNNSNGLQLAQDLAGTGVTITNVTLTCPNGASGQFTAGGTNLGIGQGVMLTSGSVANAVGPNNSASNGTCNNAGGDNLLTGLAGQPTFDACILEFDFIPIANTLSFQYVFGSEEYPEYVGSAYNDVFAFLISGPNPSGGNYNNVNLAQIPSTSLPVTINNVNGGSYAQYYVNNVGGTTVQYDGFTTVLTATVNVVPCQSYHIRLAIADAGDCSYDSGVMLASNSFNSGTFLATVASQTNATCSNGGSATVNVTGGIPPYTYTWNTNPVQTGPTATNLAPGTYTCTVSYTQCNQVISTTATVNIGGPTPVSLTPSSTAATCFGTATGTAQVTASGGSGTYTYAWTPNVSSGNSATGLSAGNYQVTVTDAQGCSATQNFTITEPPLLTAAINSTNPATCFGASNGNASAVATGGVGGYTYAWSPQGGNALTASNLPSGNYTFTVTDGNGCSATANATISQPPALLVTLAGANPTCNGLANGSLTANASGGTGLYTYSWTPSVTGTGTANNIPAGNYSVIVTDQNGCTANTNSTLIDPPALTTAISNLQMVTCNGLNNGQVQTLTTGGTGAISYAWSPGGQSTPSIQNLAPGNYTLVATDANNCQSSVNATITEPPVLNVQFSATQNISCFGGSNGLIQTNVTGGNGGYQYVWNTGATQSQLSGLQVGSYQITVTDQLGCTATNAVNLTEPPALTGSWITQQPPSCNGLSNGTLTLTASGGTGSYTYAWLPNISSTFTATNANAGTYQVTVTDANNCNITLTTTLTEPAPLVASIANMQPVTCNGLSDGTLSGTANGGTAPYVLNWSNNGGSGATSNGYAAGTYTLLVTDANNCSTSVSGTVTEPAVLTLQNTSNTPVSCFAGTDGIASVAAGGGNGSYQYAWSNGQTGTQLTNVTAGTYTVTVIDAQNCQTSLPITIAEPALLTVTVQNIVNSTCFGSNNATAAALAAGGNGTYQFTWSSGNANGAAVTNLAPGTHQVLVTDAKNCTATATFNTTEPTAVQLAVVQTQNISCNGLNNGAAQLTGTGGTGTISYTWTPNVSATNSAQNLAPGSYQILATDANGCSANTNFTLTEPAPLVASIASVQPVNCHGTSTGNATAQANGGTPAYTYQWFPGGQTGASLNNAAAGNYTVSVTDQNNCVTTANVTITQPTLLQLSVSVADDSICVGEQTILTAQAAGGSGQYSFTWNNGQNNATPTINPTQSEWAVAMVMDANGCMQSDSVLVYVSPIPVPSFLADAVCVGASTNFQEQTQKYNIPITSYVWDFGDNVTGNGTNPSHVFANDGNFPVSLTVTNQFGCTATYTADVVVHALPAPAFSVDGPKKCGPACFTFTDLSSSSDGDIAQWQWQIGNQASTDQAPQICLDAAGLYGVNLTVTSVYGCSSSVAYSSFLEVVQPPTASFILSDETVPASTPVINLTDISSGATSINWNLGDGTNSTAPFITHAYGDTGVYEILLTVTNSFGCTDTQTAQVYVEPEFTVFVPNTFTPNGDGVNDFFTAYGRDIQEFTLLVYDRWGQLIYATEKVESGWNGTYRNSGSEVQIGVYNYRIEAWDSKNKYYEFIGQVNLLR